MGYSDQQLADLEKSINGVDCDAVVLGTPSDLTQIIRIKKPVARVHFEATEIGPRRLEALVRKRKPILAAASG